MKVEMKERKTTQLVALNQHGFNFINVTKYENKHPTLKESKMRLMLVIPKMMLRWLMLESLVGHLV
jgi:hypothetical protein